MLPLKMFHGFSLLKNSNTSSVRLLTAGGQNKPKTGILMLNMGGPSEASVAETEKFLKRLFLDTDIMTLPVQSVLGPWIAKRRAPKVSAKYAEIGGGSPILKWTREQGSLLVQLLNERRKESSPHKYYVGFRYADPLLEVALNEMESDGIERVVAFSQYPQYSCSTTGSSFNSLASILQNQPSTSKLNQMKWSVIDRWPLNQGLVLAISDLISKEVSKLPPEIVSGNKMILLFSAHSLPMKVVNRGDTYPSEVASTVLAVMNQLKFKYPYRLVWQSKVGPLQWLSPQTDDAVKGYAKRGIKNFIIVPIAFVNEHIETLHELDIEYGHDLKKELNLEHILRVPTPNIHPKFIEGIYSLVSQHLDSNEISSQQMKTRCPLCVNPSCAVTRSWIKSIS